MSNILPSIVIGKKSIQLHGNKHIKWSPSKPMNKFSTEIFVKFHNYRQSSATDGGGGVILMINGNSPDKEYVILEVYRNTFIVKTKTIGTSIFFVRYALTSASFRFPP